MKRLVALLLICTIFTTSCTGEFQSKEVSMVEETKLYGESVDMLCNDEKLSLKDKYKELEIALDDPNLLQIIEEDIYSELVNTLDSDEFFVENVNAIYISKEYLEETSYNSKSSIYFGYRLAELDNIFVDDKYVFTYENGNTVVLPFEDYDDTYDKVIKNVAIGTGVILISVAISIVSAPAVPAVSVVFAASAKTGTTIAVSSGVFSGLVSGVITGVQTNNVEETLKSVAIAGSDGFKWGAITGIIHGGVTSYIGLKGATLKGLSINEAAIIQKESKYPLEIIKNIKSMDEYKAYQSIGLTAQKVDGKWALVQEIDWSYVDELKGLTNIQRVMNGNAPIDKFGNPYEIHHIGQQNDSPFAILKSSQHASNDALLHIKNIVSEIDRVVFAKEKKVFWKKLLEMNQLNFL